MARVDADPLIVAEKVITGQEKSSRGFMCTGKNLNHLVCSWGFIARSLSYYALSERRSQEPKLYCEIKVFSTLLNSLGR